MLENKVIIYDDSCPMCRIYTYLFVAWGFLAAKNRIGFASAPESITSRVDLDRGRHEIPLFDRETGKTIYGLAALGHILGSRMPWLNPFFRSRLFWLMFHPLYEIITYNRRVIAGCKHLCGFDCAPDLNRFYRTLYLLITFSVTALIGVALLLNGTLPAKIGVVIMAAFAITGALANILVRAFSGLIAGWNHAGNYATTVVMVALALTPLTLLPAATIFASWIVVAFALILGLSELRRRSL